MKSPIQDGQQSVRLTWRGEHIFLSAGGKETKCIWPLPGASKAPVTKWKRTPTINENLALPKSSMPSPATAGKNGISSLDSAIKSRVWVGALHKRPSQQWVGQKPKGNFQISFRKVAPANFNVKDKKIQQATLSALWLQLGTGPTSQEHNWAHKMLAVTDLTNDVSILQENAKKKKKTVCHLTHIKENLKK